MALSKTSTAQQTRLQSRSQQAKVVLPALRLLPVPCPVVQSSPCAIVPGASCARPRVTTHAATTRTLWPAPQQNPLESLATDSADLISRLAGPFRWLCTAPVKVLFETLTAMQLLGLPYSPEALCLAVGSAFILYNLDRLKDANGAGDIQTRGDRAAFFTTHKSAIEAATATVGVLCVLSVARLPAMPFQLLLPGLALCLAYSKVKQLPGVKTPFLGAMWTLASTLLPALTLSATSPVTALPLPFVAAFAFFNTCCLSAFVDMRDIDGDRLEGVPTIPATLSMDGCKALIATVCLINAALCVAVGRPELATAPACIAARCAVYQPGQGFMSEFCMAAPALAFITACL